MCKHMKLRASLQVSAMFWGEDSQQVKDICMIMDLTDKFMSLDDKRPEDQMLFHTTLYLIKRTTIRVNSWPEAKNFDKVKN